MRKFGKLTALCLIVSMFFSFHAGISQVSPIVGIWRGVEEGQQQVEIEFTPGGEYHLRIDGQLLTNEVKSWGKVMYRWSEESDVLSIVIFGDSSPDAQAHLRAAFTEKGLLRLEVCTDGGQAVHGILLKKV